MKYSKYLLVIMLIFSLALVSCKKTITEPDESTIVGKWQISGLANKWVLTTTSDQLVKIPYSGSGQITSFGSYNSVYNGLILLISDPLVIATVELEYGMVLTDAIVIDGVTGVGVTSNSNTDKVFEGIVNYVFNGTTLTITESILTNPLNGAETVTVSVSLLFAIANIPVNTQTYIQAPDIWMTYYYNGPFTTEFFDDGSIVRSKPSTQGSIEENGTWTLNDNILTVNIIDGNTTSEDIYNYSVEGNSLSLVESYDLCTDDADCLSYYEDLFGIKDGSISGLGVEVTSIFNKTN